VIHPLIDTQTHRGFWWTPAAAEHRLSGTLTITRGEPRLEVEGDFGHELISEKDGQRVYSGMPENQRRIVGMTTDGKQVTLDDCFFASGNIRSPGIPTTVYRARLAVFGHMFEDEVIELDEIELRTSELEQWIGLVPFPLHVPEPDADPPSATIVVTRPSTNEFPLADDQRVRITFEVGTSGVGVVATEASLRYAAWIGLRFSKPRAIAEASVAVGQLRNFLSLAVGKPVTLLAVDGHRDDVVDKAGHRIPLQLLYPIAHNPEPSQQGVQPWEMLFTYREARDRLADVFGAWLAHHDVLEPVFALYFGTLYNAHLYIEQRFLAFAQAIETYDRRRRPTAKESDPAEHKERIREILKATPEKHRTWLKDKLAFSNELVLARRIAHVLSVCPNVTARIVGEEGADKFVKAVRNTRNYLTHYDQTRKRHAVTEPRDLYRLTLQLRAILETAFLLELAFECADIEAVLERARRFEQIDLQR
jgi:hypothetical protein